MDVDGFFERYRQAFEAGDVDWIAAVYELPLAVIRPHRKVWLEDASKLRKYLQQVHDTWSWSGLKRVRLRVREDSLFDPGLPVVHAGWRLYDSSDSVLTDINVTYILRPVSGEEREHCVDDRFQIVGIVAHNEEQARAPIIREAAPKETEA